MLRVLIDTCVWLDMAKDYRHQPTLHALESLINGGKVHLVLPRQAIEEFVRNKERIIRDSGRSLSSTFKRVKEAVRQFGNEEDRQQAIAVMDDVDHRIAILGEAVNESIARIEKLFADAEVVETTDAVKLRAAQRAVEKRAPFHKEKNSIGDAILIEIYRDDLSVIRNNVRHAFVTHNKHDFSNMLKDERQPHPDIANLFGSDSSTYALSLGEVLNSHAPEWMENVKWEFEYVQEPRRLSEIMEAENILCRQVWYNRHWNLRNEIERGKHKVVSREEWDKHPKRHQRATVDYIWEGALASAKRTEEELGLENLVQ